MEGTAYTRNSVAVAAVCIALALTLSACGDVGLGLLDDPSLSEDLKLIVIMCELVDPSRKTAYKTCLRRFGVLRHGRIPPDGLRSALAAGTSSNGTAVIDFLTVRSKTTGKKLPTWTADLPETLTRVGRREIAVSVNITDEEYRSPRGVPKGMTVTLYAVDKKGKREEVGTRSGKVAKSGAGRVVFKNVVAAGSHHTVEVDFDGGSLFPGVLVYNAANVGKAITRAPARSAGRSSSPASSVLVGPRVELQPRLRQAGSVQRTTTLVTDSFDVKGTTAAGKLPKWKVDIPSTRVKRSAAPRDIAVGLMIAKNNFSPSSSAPNELEAALFDVDKKGKRKKIATQRVAISAEDLGASVDFEGVRGAKDHYQVELEVSGGSAGGGLLVYYASSAVPGTNDAASTSSVTDILSALRWRWSSAPLPLDHSDR